MYYGEYLPANDLEPFIAGFWKFIAPDDVPPGTPHVAPPDGCVSLVLHANRMAGQHNIFLVGPDVGMLRNVLYPGSVYVGIRFAPGAVGCFLDFSGAQLRGQSIELSAPNAFHPYLDLVGPGFEQFSLLEAELRRQKRKAPDPEVAKVAQILKDNEGNRSIASVLKAAFIGERQLQRRFRRDVGLSMKEFARVRRMRAAMVRLVLHRQKTLDISLDGGYYDQAHFLNEFRDFADMKPSELERYLRKIEHGFVAVDG
jgi:AraC-like DNA-binding protein